MEKHIHSPSKKLIERAFYAICGSLLFFAPKVFAVPPSLNFDQLWKMEERSRPPTATELQQNEIFPGRCFDIYGRLRPSAYTLVVGHRAPSTTKVLVSFAPDKDHDAYDDGVPEGDRQRIWAHFRNEEARVSEALPYRNTVQSVYYWGDPGPRYTAFRVSRVDADEGTLWIGRIGWVNPQHNENFELRELCYFFEP